MDPNPNPDPKSNFRIHIPVYLYIYKCLTFFCITFIQLYMFPIESKNYLIQLLLHYVQVFTKYYIIQGIDILFTLHRFKIIVSVVFRSVFKNLSLLHPELIIPDLLDKLSLASQSLTEPHRFHVCIQVRQDK